MMSRAPGKPLDTWQPENAKWSPTFAVYHRESTGPFPKDGIYLIDKPAGCTSGFVVQMLRRKLRQRRIGHAGTLDPNATGLLLCIAGKATKANKHIHELPKTYSATIRLGQITASLDSETPVTCEVTTESLSAERVKSVVESFVGSIVQTTPHFSAVKVNGQRLYKSAHRGQAVSVLPKRSVTIHAITDICIELPVVSFDVVCSTGTYVRSLAADIGDKLEVGAHLASLRRIAIGPFSCTDAVPLSAFDNLD